MHRAVFAIFFLSGLCSIVFESLWFHQAALALGSSVWATSLVLSAFMSGLALGGVWAARVGDRIARPIRAYALAEATVAVSGTALVFLAPGLGPWVASVLGPLAEEPWALNPARLLVAFVMLLVPSTAMGTTLPLLVSALGRDDSRFGRVLGALYGWNTAGAVTGAIVAEMLLTRHLGVRASGSCAGAVTAAVALVAVAIARRAPQLSVAAAEPSAPGTAAPPPAPDRAGLAAWRWLAAAFLSGLALLALEVVWFRFLLLFVLAESASFAMMLASVLGGIALGGLAGSVLCARVADPHRFAAPVAVATGVSCLLGYALFSPAPVPPLPAQMVFGGIIRMAVALALPTALLSGILFTLVGTGLRGVWRAEARSAGAVTFANTLGAALGSLFGGFALLPGLGAENSLFGLAVVYAAIAMLLARGAPRRSLAAAAVAFVVAAALFPFGAMRERHLLRPLQGWADPTSVGEIWVREGLTETALLVETRFLERRESLRLLTDSYTMSATNSSARRYMKLYVYLPAAIHPRLESVLLISYGVGSTAKAIVDEAEVRSVDVVDISRDILDLARVVFPRGNPLRDPRVRVHVEDGRWFLMSTSRRFDLITGEPPPPNVAGVVHLYTREYFELLRSRLAPGGFVTYWLPMHGLSDRSGRAILRGFCGAFEDCSLWHGSGPNLMMLGSRGARGPVTEERFARQWTDGRVASELRDLGFERPEQLGALFVGDARYLAEVTRGTPALVDDEPKAIVAQESAAGATDRLSRSWLDPVRAAERFDESALVRRLWPARLRAASLPYFRLQRLIGGALVGLPAGQPAPWSDLHEVLTRSSLRFPVPVLLDSSSERQRIAAEVGSPLRETPAARYELGISRLAERRYPEAAKHFAAAANDRQLGLRARLLRVYSLCLAARPDEARAAASAAALAPSRGRAVFAQWIRSTFGFDVWGHAPDP